MTIKEITQLFQTTRYSRCYDYLYNRYYPKLFSLLVNKFSYQIDREKLKDLLTDAFIKGFERIGQFDINKSSFYTWMHTIAYNNCLQYLKSKREILVEKFNIEVYEEDETEKDIIDLRPLLLSLNDYPNEMYRNIFIDNMHGLDRIIITKKYDINIYRMYKILEKVRKDLFYNTNEYKIYMQDSHELSVEERNITRYKRNNIAKSKRYNGDLNTDIEIDEGIQIIFTEDDINRIKEFEDYLKGIRPIKKEVKIKEKKTRIKKNKSIDKENKRDYHKNYYANDKEYYKAYRKKYYESHKEEIKKYNKTYQKEYISKNKESVKAKRKAYRLKKKLELDSGFCLEDKTTSQNI